MSCIVFEQSRESSLDYTDATREDGDMQIHLCSLHTITSEFMLCNAIPPLLLPYRSRCTTPPHYRRLKYQLKVNCPVSA